VHPAKKELENMEIDEILEKQIDQKDTTLSELNQMRGALVVILRDTKEIITNPAMEQIVKDCRVTGQIDRALTLITRGEGWR
jgi:hypothetical protein